MRGWQLSDIEKLSARGFRVKMKPILHVSDINDFKARPKTISLKNLLDKAQSEFNAYIRARDYNRGCISCQSGKVQQASHFYSTGQFSALRFNEDNCHGSCTQCNHYKHGNLLHYRQALIKRIGLQRLENLEFASMLTPHKNYSRFELELIYTMYREKNER